MTGYWQRPEATDEVMDEAFFFASDDIAVLQADGYLKIVDYKKDMIVVSGFNVHPNELESVLSEHPLVIECAVIGVPDKRSGEAVKIFVVVREPAIVEALRDFRKKLLTAYKVPRHIEFIDELPKSSVGKVLRRELS